MKPKSRMHTLNNAQRKALAQVVQEAYERLIKEAKDKEGVLIDEITQTVKMELGADTLENQIAAFHKQIATLEEKKKQLGFGHYGLEEGSKAKQLVDARARKESSTLHELDKERARTLMALWTATTLTEAKALLERIVE